MELGFLTTRVFPGEEDERQVARVEPGQREKRRDEDREGRLHHLLPLRLRVDAVRGGRLNRSLRKSVNLSQLNDLTPRGVRLFPCARFSGNPGTRGFFRRPHEYEDGFRKR